MLSWLLLVLAGMGGWGCGSLGGDASGMKDGRPAEPPDPLVLERVRVKEKELGFPEAYSVLIPEGWKLEADLVRNISPPCYGDQVVLTWRVTSPDSAIRYMELPIRAWYSTNDTVLERRMAEEAKVGGCPLDRPMNAETYLREVFIPEELQGAEVDSVEENAGVVGKLYEATGRGRGWDSGYLDQYRSSWQPEYGHSSVLAHLRWKNGEEGLAVVTISVTTIPTKKREPFSYDPVEELSSYMVSERSCIRFPAERREEAERAWIDMKAGIRLNPEWLERLKMLEAAYRRIPDPDWHPDRKLRDLDHWRMTMALHQDGTKPPGEDSLRTWEGPRKEIESGHWALVEPLREMKVWRDPQGNTVEISGTYERAWMDGRYFVASSKPGFDPDTFFPGRNWREMVRVEQ